MLRFIQICQIRQWYLFVLLWTGNTLFAQIWSKKSKLSVYNLVKNIFSDVTPGSRDIIILVTWPIFYFSKMLTQTRLWVLMSPSFSVLKSTTASIAYVTQNLWTCLFFTRFIEIMILFYKKCWGHRKNDRIEEISVWYCVLSVT